MPLNADGFRGTIFLRKGKYSIYGNLYLHTSGVVLRGAGHTDNPENSTILIGTGVRPHQGSLLTIGYPEKLSETLYHSSTIQPIFKTKITNEIIPVGQQSFTVEHADLLKIDDRILIEHECSESWLKAVNYGATDTDQPWKIGDHPIIYDRNVTKIDGNKIFIDAPVFYTLDQKRATTNVYLYPKNLSVVEHVGIENIRFESAYQYATDEDHLENLVLFRLVKNAWARHCTAAHFIRAGFQVEYSKQVTIQKCNAIDPISKIEGGRRYNFDLEQGSQLILVKDCYARNGRHHYISDGKSTSSGNVFLNCISDAAYAMSEAHRHWTTGLLFDGHQEINVRKDGKQLLALFNRGSYGASHGWSCAHCVAWNIDLGIGRATIQQPPTAQNYCIGCQGVINNKGTFTHPLGYIEGANKKGLFPKSLYEAQLGGRSK